MDSQLLVDSRPAAVVVAPPNRPLTRGLRRALEDLDRSGADTPFQSERELSDEDDNGGEEDEDDESPLFSAASETIVAFSRRSSSTGFSEDEDEDEEDDDDDEYYNFRPPMVVSMNERSMIPISIFLLCIRDEVWD